MDGDLSRIYLMLPSIFHMPRTFSSKLFKSLLFYFPFNDPRYSIHEKPHLTAAIILPNGDLKYIKCLLHMLNINKPYNSRSSSCKIIMQ